MGPTKAVWQYHPQSDRHSKIACWGMLFDLMQHSALLREHLASGKVSFGVNHTMTDWKNDKPKKLDLVLCRPAGTTSARKLLTFAAYADRWQLDLSADQRDRLAGLPEVTESP